VPPYFGRGYVSGHLWISGVGVGVLLAADSQPTSSSGYRASLWDPWPDFILFIFFRLTYLILLSKASSLTRKRVCSLQWNHSLVPITILYCLIWDCVPFLSPLTTRRDYGGGILTRLHTGPLDVSYVGESGRKLGKSYKHLVANIIKVQYILDYRISVQHNLLISLDLVFTLLITWTIHDSKEIGHGYWKMSKLTQTQ
jgi:hypothetical protein